MKKPNSRTNITNDLNEIVSLSRNMKHVSSDPLTLETFFRKQAKAFTTRLVFTARAFTTMFNNQRKS